MFRHHSNSCHSLCFYFFSPTRLKCRVSVSRHDSATLRQTPSLLYPCTVINLLNCYRRAGEEDGFTVLSLIFSEIIRLIIASRSEEKSSTYCYFHLEAAVPVAASVSIKFTAKNPDLPFKKLTYSHKLHILVHLYGV